MSRKQSKGKTTTPTTTTTNKNEVSNADWKSEVESCLTKGGDLNKVGKFAESLKTLEKGHNLILKNQTPSNQDFCLIRLYSVLVLMCDSCLKLGKTEIALSHIQQSLKLAEGFGEPMMIGTSCYQVGVVLLNLNKFQEAIQYYDRAEKIYSEGLLKDQLPALLVSFALLFFKLGDYELSIKKSLQASTLFTNKKTPLFAQLLSDLGKTLSFNGQHSEAISTLKEALSLTKLLHSQESWQYSQVLKNFGDAYLYSDEKSQISIQKAHDSFCDSAELDDRLDGHRSHIASNFYSLGQTFDFTGQFEQALENHGNALTIATEVHGKGNPKIVKYIVAVASSLYNLKKFPEALKKFEEASKSDKDSKHIVRIVIHKSNCLFLMGKDQEARKSMETINSVQIQEYLKRRPRLAKSLIPLVAALKEMLGIIPNPEKEEAIKIKELQVLKEMHSNYEKEKAKVENKGRDNKKEADELECAVCGKVSNSRCSGCQRVFYCGKDCQRSHWKEHKLVCNK